MLEERKRYKECRSRYLTPYNWGLRCSGTGAVVGVSVLEQADGVPFLSVDGSQDFEGVNLRVIQKIRGHKNLNVLAHYLEVSEQEKEAALAMIEF